MIAQLCMFLKQGAQVTDSIFMTRNNRVSVANSKFALAYSMFGGDENCHLAFVERKGHFKSVNELGNEEIIGRSSQKPSRLQITTRGGAVDWAT